MLQIKSKLREIHFCVSNYSIFTFSPNYLDSLLACVGTSVATILQNTFEDFRSKKKSRLQKIHNFKLKKSSNVSNLTKFQYILNMQIRTKIRTD